jgi:hypothetical protein
MRARKSYAPAKVSLQRLVRSGWTTGPMTFDSNSGRTVWQVCGVNGANRLKVEGTIPAEAWHRPTEAVAACGMLSDRPRPSRGTYEGRLQRDQP